MCAHLFDEDFDNSFEPEREQDVNLSREQLNGALVTLLREFHSLQLWKFDLDDYVAHVRSLDKEQIYYCAEGLLNELKTTRDPLPGTCLDIIRDVADRMIAFSSSSPGREDELYDRAEKLYYQALTRAQRRGDQIRIGYTQLKMADLCELQGDLDQAVAHCEGGLRLLLAQPTNLSETTLPYLGRLVQLLHASGSWEKVDEYADYIVRFATTPGYDGTPAALQALAGVAEVYRKQANYGDAEDISRRLVSGWEKLGARIDVNQYTKALIDLAGCCQFCGHYDEAEQHYRKAFKLLDTAENRKKGHGYLVEARDGLIDMLKAQGRFDEAWELEGNGEQESFF
jgi:tetratricopeptide (TPR) repeat protein